MDAGSLHDWVRLEERVSARDEAGQEVGSWTLRRECWADVRFLSGLETIRAGMDVDITQASIRLHYLDAEGLSARWRVVLGSQVFDVKGVQPDLINKDFVDLRAVTGASNG